MSVLEDIEMEMVKERVGALVLLTKNSSCVSFLELHRIGVLNGALGLAREGYVIKNDEGYYRLTDEGRKYAEDVLRSIKT